MATDRPLRRSRLVAFLLAGFAFLCCAGFLKLGIWQVERRAWKLDLIAHVDERVHAPPVPAPARTQWQQITREHDEYRAVCVSGEYLPTAATVVQAVTRLGPGHWLLAALRRDDGTLVLINRGFVDDEHLQSTQHSATLTGLQTVCGLLRISEPKGAFLHHNDPATQHWYSRDVSAIAQAQSLNAADVAPYFIDAFAAETNTAATLENTWPRAGLTVIQFPNNHLVYALTWFALALLSAGGGIKLWQLRRDGHNDGHGDDDNAEPRNEHHHER